MIGSEATFEVHEIFELSSLDAIVLRGHIRTGKVSAGMTANVWVDGDLYMATAIKSVEYVDGKGSMGRIGLVLDTPDVDVREAWLGLCQVGDVLPIVVSKESRASPD